VLGLGHLLETEFSSVLLRAQPFLLVLEHGGRTSDASYFGASFPVGSTKRAILT